MFLLNRIGARWKLIVVVASFSLALANGPAGAVDQEKSPAAEPKHAEPPVVQVSRVVEREVTDYEVFAGRIEAAESVKVASRVTGYLTKVAFKEGSNVKKGDLLFEIDSRPYQAQVEQAEAELRLNEARLKLAETEYERAKELVKTAAVSQAELTKVQAAQQQAQASLEAAKANLVAQQLTLGFCKIVSPIDGRAGRSNLTPGNLVKQDETVLTTIVSVDPVCVSFDMDEHTWLRLARAARDGGTKDIVAGAAVPVFVAATDEKGFPHEGVVNFVSNEFNPSTGTISVRAILPNLPTKESPQVFIPGMFVRARIPIGPPHRALLVSDSAIRRQAGRATVSIVGDDDQVQSRSITAGAIQDDGLRVVEHGLKLDDRVVIGNDPLKYDKDKIRPQLVPMRTNETKRPSATK
jgi:multidrug efflux system membrane fusion protein